MNGSPVMKVRELIEKLQQFDPESEIDIIHSSGSCGSYILDLAEVRGLPRIIGD